MRSKSTGARVVCVAAAVSGTLLAALLATPAAVEAAQPAGSTRVESELAGIRASLEQIVALLTAQSRRQEGELLLRRIELKTTRLVPIEERLRRVENEIGEVAGERRRLREVAKRMEERSFDAETEEEREGVAQEAMHMVGAIEQLDQRAGLLDEELARLQTDQTQLAAEIDQLERELELVQARAQRPPG
jgi:hypothetical protein